ncbi:hypothetical protein [Clostridium perfringens]|uniref:hypothetical protein n=1 Tax=Clostridium perfringens TaxID=1502 RepID=UPI0015B8AD7C|nr:hypothetical protein [Clostridium perfringens]
MDCICNECHIKVPSSVTEHFTSDDGRTLCEKCSKGVKSCSDRIKNILIELENKDK